MREFFEKRILLLAGHYGSGKTEFAVSLALAAAKQGIAPLAVVDIDVVNPYFRSRECSALLKQAGVEVYGSMFGHDVTAEIPELAADIRGPLEDEQSRVIVDLGGNEAGARIIKPYAKYFSAENSCLALVINANRYETGDLPSALYQIELIEQELGRAADCLINNTHLLRETTPADIEKGHELCQSIAEARGIRVLCDCYPRGIITPAADNKELKPFAMGMYLRQSWLDR